MTERNDLTYNAGMIPPPDNTAGVMGDHPPSPEDEQCPVCGYHCLGRGGVGCIDKPSMLQTSPSSEGREGFTGHTPGPWSLAPDGGGGESLEVVAAYKRETREDGRTIESAYWIATCEASLDFDTDDEALIAENQANARLIAAAPDLPRENTELRAFLTEAQAEIERLKADAAETLAAWNRENELRRDVEEELTHLRAEHERLKREVSRLDTQCLGFQKVITELRRNLHEGGAQ